MANIPFSDLLDDVLPHLAADPSDPVTESAIRRVVRDFCAGSWVWQHLADPADILARELEVDIESPTGTDVAAVMSVSVDGAPLEKKAVHWLDENLPRWRTDTGAARFFTQLQPDQVMLAPLPSTTEQGAVSMTLALQPSRSADGFPRWLADRYGEALADGAVARLMLMPSKPWTDLASGSARRDAFEAAIASARGDAVTALQGAPVRTSSQH